MRLCYPRITSSLLPLLVVLFISCLPVMFVEVKMNLGMVCLLALVEQDSAVSPEQDGCSRLLVSDGIRSTNKEVFAGLGEYLVGNVPAAVNFWRLSPQVSVRFLLNTGDNVLGYRSSDILYLFENHPDLEAIEMARSRYESARQINSEDSSVLYRLGIVSHLQQQIEEAKAYYIRALESNRFRRSDIPSGQFASAYWLARLAWDQGDKGSACKYMLLAIEYSDNTDITQGPFAGWGCIVSPLCVYNR